MILEYVIGMLSSWWVFTFGDYLLIKKKALENQTIQRVKDAVTDFFSKQLH